MYKQLFNSGYEHYGDKTYPWCTGDPYIKSPDWKGPGWYRVTGAAGTRIPERPPGVYHCGTHFPGWMRGVHPSTPGDQVVATICFDYGSNGDCISPVSTTVINCGEYYLYNLPDTPYCMYRYCGSLV